MYIIDISGNWDELLPLMELAYNNSHHASTRMTPFEAFYGRPCKLQICWDKVEKKKMIGPELVDETTVMIFVIRKKLQTAQCRWKGYTDNKRRDLAFETSDHVYLKVSPMNGLLRFEEEGKLSPRFIGPFEILERVGTTSYTVTLPSGYSRIHNVFYISMLCKCHSDPSPIIQNESFS